MKEQKAGPAAVATEQSYVILKEEQMLNRFHLLLDDHEREKLGLELRSQFLGVGDHLVLPSNRDRQAVPPGPQR